MLGPLLTRLIIISVGLLYPAYSSYKTIRSANVKHYVRWMMYWTVFALFTSAEYVADIFISWLPFYYEMKVVLVVWLMSSYTKGASIIYRKVLHPILARREVSIDQWIGDQQEKSMQVLLDAGRRGVAAAGNAALSGVTSFAPNTGSTVVQNNAASGIMGSIVSGLQSGITSMAAAAPTETKRSTPESGVIIQEIDEEDETFEEIDESELVSSSAGESEDEEDEEYTPPATRGNRKHKNKAD